LRWSGIIDTNNYATLKATSTQSLLRLQYSTTNFLSFFASGTSVNFIGQYSAADVISTVGLVVNGNGSYINASRSDYTMDHNIKLGIIGDIPQLILTNPSNGTSMLWISFETDNDTVYNLRIGDALTDYYGSGYNTDLYCSGTRVIRLTEAGYVGINKDIPLYPLDINGITCTNNQILITLETGTAPIVVDSTTTCTNLNADLLDGNHASAFAAASHTHSYDNYVSWDVSANGATASQIFKSGSASSYKGVNFVGTGTVSVSTNSNANGFINVNISGSGSTYTHPAYTVFNPTLSGALVLASLTTDAIGAVTAVTTRTLTLANLGYTGATNATYFTGHTIYLNGTSLVTIGSGGYLNVVATNAAGDPVVTLTGNAGAYRYDISVSGIPNCTLTGYTAGSTGLVAATDTLKVAFSKLQYQMPKTLYTNVTDVTLVGATPNDFYSYTLPANTLSSDNQRLELLYSGSNAANTNGKTIQFYFGGTSHITITNSSTTSLNWFLNITIVRASSSTLRVAFNGSWYTFGNGNTWGTGINFATTNVIKLVAQGGASSDIIGKLCKITHFSS
jgi:hypothetical protein